MRTDGPAISDFLAARRFALVGLSRNPQDFSRHLAKELRQRGYDVIGVNPAGGDDGGQRIYPSVADIPGSVDGALLLTPPARSADAVRECVRAGVPRVWLHRGFGQGAVSDAAVQAAREAGIGLVTGECPLMFFHDAAWFHRAHGTVERLDDRWPMPRTVPRARLLAALQLSVGVGGAVAGAMLLADTSGALLGFPPTLLADSPFDDFLVPGLILFLVNGLGSLAGAALSLRRSPRAARVALGLGAFLVAWIALQVVWIGFVSLLQPILGIVGLAEIALGWRQASETSSKSA